MIRYITLLTATCLLMACKKEEEKPSPTELTPTNIAMQQLTGTMQLGGTMYIFRIARPSYQNDFDTIEVNSIPLTINDVEGGKNIYLEKIMETGSNIPSGGNIYPTNDKVDGCDGCVVFTGKDNGYYNDRSVTLVHNTTTGKIDSLYVSATDASGTKEYQMINVSHILKSK